jgi:glycosyltransferase involved in cell wall biosynthesis
MSRTTQRDWTVRAPLANPVAQPKRAWLMQPSTVVLTSFPPRECGIATFARDLIGAVEGATHLKSLARLASPAPWVIAMNDGDQSYAYGPQVRMSIARDNRDDYARAAHFVNASANTQVVSIQHEYGLFGGEYGAYLLDFIRMVERPVVLTMHTVLEEPDHALRQVTEALIQQSAMVVVLARSARDILRAHYPNADLAKVVFIPHGTPAVRQEPTRRFKRELGLDGHTVLSTFGLLGRDKGIEHAIRALPEIVARHPEVVYLVLGETHPGQRRYEGEAYREMLEALVDELNLRDHVRFYNHYLSMAELLRFLQATDVYILPYLNPKQIVSGTLAYAVACGKAVVSTPFVYAREMLSEGHGELARFRDPASITRAVNAYLDDPAHKAAVEARAYNSGLRMHWPSVGVTYCRLLRRVVDEHRAQLRVERAHARRKVALQATLQARQALSIRPIAAGLGLAPGYRAATSRPRGAPGVAQARLAATTSSAVDSARS